MSDRLERNKNAAVAFYELMANECRPRGAIERCAAANDNTMF